MFSVRTADRTVAKQFMSKRKLVGWEVMFSFISHQKEILVCEESLRTLFSTFGEVLDCVIRSYNRNDNTHLASHKPQTGYGFVEFKEKATAEFVVANIKSGSFVPLPSFVTAESSKEDANEVHLTINLDCSFSRRSISRMSEVKSPEVSMKSSQGPSDIRGSSNNQPNQSARAAPSAPSIDSRPSAPPSFSHAIPAPPSFTSIPPVQMQSWQRSDSLPQYSPISGPPYLVMPPSSYFPSYPPQQFSSPPPLPMNSYPVPMQAPYVLHPSSVPVSSNVQAEPNARNIYVPAAQDAPAPSSYSQSQSHRYVVHAAGANSNDYHSNHAEQSMQLPPPQYSYVSTPGPPGYYSQYFFPHHQPLSIPQQHLHQHQQQSSSFTAPSTIASSMSLSVASSNLPAEQILTGYSTPGSHLSHPSHLQSQDAMNRSSNPTNNPNFQFRH